MPFNSCIEANVYDFWLEHGAAFATPTKYQNENIACSIKSFINAGIDRRKRKIKWAKHNYKKKI